MAQNLLIAWIMARAKNKSDIFSSIQLPEQKVFCFTHGYELYTRWESSLWWIVEGRKQNIQIHFLFTNFYLCFWIDFEFFFLLLLSGVALSATFVFSKAFLNLQNIFSSFVVWLLFPFLRIYIRNIHCVIQIAL